MSRNDCRCDPLHAFILLASVIKDPQTVSKNEEVWMKCVLSLRMKDPLEFECSNILLVCL